MKDSRGVQRQAESEYHTALTRLFVIFERCALRYNCLLLLPMLLHGQTCLRPRLDQMSAVKIGHDEQSLLSAPAKNSVYTEHTGPTYALACDPEGQPVWLYSQPTARDTVQQPTQRARGMSQVRSHIRCGIWCSRYSYKHTKGNKNISPRFIGDHNYLLLDTAFCFWFCYEELRVRATSTSSCELSPSSSTLAPLHRDHFVRHHASKRCCGRGPRTRRSSQHHGLSDT